MLATPPTDYLSVSELATRAAEARGKPADCTLAPEVWAHVEARSGGAWIAVLSELQADNAHVPGSLRAYAWRAGSADMPEIGSVFWREHFETDWLPVDRASLARQGWRFEGMRPLDPPVMALHVKMVDDWALPLVPPLEAEAFIARYAGETSPLAKAPEESPLPVDAPVQGHPVPSPPRRGRPDKGTPALLDEARRRGWDVKPGLVVAEAARDLLRWRGEPKSGEGAPAEKTLRSAISRMRVNARKAAEKSA